LIMRILTLIDDASANRKLHTEHGLSFLIEINGRSVLMDAGASDKFLRNAVKMHADLKNLEAVIISHNHRDHTGGLDSLFKFLPRIKVFAVKDIRGEYYRRIGPLNISICWNKHFLNRHRGNFILFNHFQEVCPGLYVMASEANNPEFMPKDASLLKRERGKFVPDDFKHEIFAVAFPDSDKSKGCVVISSCSHSGIVNILETVRATWTDSPIIGVVGGFHLMYSQPEFLRDLAVRLSELSDGCVYACHCTGVKAYERLKASMGDQIQRLRTGEELTFN